MSTDEQAVGVGGTNEQAPEVGRTNQEIRPTTGSPIGDQPSQIRSAPMAPTQPVFSQMNLVVTDMDATLAFYRALGLEFADHTGREWPAGSGARHAEVTMPSGMHLEFDNVEMTKLWHHGWRDPSVGVPTSRAIIGFAVPSRQDVDQRYAELTTAGHLGRQAPYDAFWGGRYAVVADPDGNECGLMSPPDPDRAYIPGPDPT